MKAYEIDFLEEIFLFDTYETAIEDLADVFD
jgi:hypothetical protein